MKHILHFPSFSIFWRNKLEILITVRANVLISLYKHARILNRTRNLQMLSTLLKYESPIGRWKMKKLKLVALSARLNKGSAHRFKFKLNLHATPRFLVKSLFAYKRNDHLLTDRRPKSKIVYTVMRKSIYCRMILCVRSKTFPLVLLHCQYVYSTFRNACLFPRSLLNLYIF